MPVGRRTRAAARVVEAKVDAFTAALQALFLGLVLLTAAVVALAVRA